MIITQSMLVKRGACVSGINDFLKMFPSGHVRVTLRTALEHADEIDWYFVLSRLVPGFSANRYHNVANEFHNTARKMYRLLHDVHGFPLRCRTCRRTIDEVNDMINRCFAELAARLILYPELRDPSTQVKLRSYRDPATLLTCHHVQAHVRKHGNVTP